MFGIIDGLEVSKKFREASAQADLAEASKMLKDAQKLLSTARTRAAPPTNLEHLKVAARASIKAAKILPPLKQKISNAVETLPEIRAKADPIAAEVAKVDTGIKKVDVKIAGTRDRLERVPTTDLIGRKFPF